MARRLVTAGSASQPAGASTALPPSFTVVQRGSGPWLVGDLALPVQEQERMERDMLGLLEALRRSLRERLTTFSFKHPSRGTPLYNHLQLDGSRDYTLGYDEARERAVRMAEAFAPRVGQFYADEVDRIFQEAAQRVQESANKHVQDLAHQRHHGYAIIPKYTALSNAVRDICAAVKNGPALSSGPILATMSKMPVSARGIHAAVEGMKNLHKLDEYQVACAVAAQLASHAAGYTESSWDGVVGGIRSRIRKAEAVEVPLAAPSSNDGGGGSKL